MWKYLFKKTYFRLIFSIGNNQKNITQLSKESGMTIAHLTRVFDHWEEEGVIFRIKQRNPQSNSINLTELGKQISTILNELFHMANRSESKIKNKKNKK